MSVLRNNTLNITPVQDFQYIVCVTLKKLSD